MELNGGRGRRIAGVIFKGNSELLRENSGNTISSSADAGKLCVCATKESSIIEILVEGYEGYDPLLR